MLQYRATASATHSMTTASSIAVKAYYVGNSIDIVKITSTSAQYTEMPCKFESKSTTITLDEERQQFLSLFKYGSVVFFNVPEDVHAGHIQHIREVAMKTSISDSLQHTEQYRLYVDSTLQKASAMKKSDELFVRSLDSFNLQIVGAIMAQTVALDHYADSIDRKLEIFMRLNSEVSINTTRCLL